MAIAMKNGVKVTVDVSDINVKFTKTIQELNAGLTKTQKNLNLQYNAQGMLVDSLQRCVEGLSTWQIKLGMWIDETGKARTLAGEYAEGLSRTELELGFYADELGNVYDRQDEVIRKTKDAIDAENEKREALQRTREAFADSFEALGDGVGRFNSLLSSFEGLSGEAEETRKSLVRVFGTLDAATQAFSAIQNLQAWFKEAKTSALAFNTALKASETTAGGLKAAIASIGGPWTLVASGVAAAVAAFVAFNATADQMEVPNAELDGLSEHFKEIKQRAKEAGEEIRGVADVLKYGAFYESGSELEEAQKKLADQKAQFDALMEKNGVTSMDQWRGEFGGTNESAAEFAKVAKGKDDQEKIDQSLADYNNAMEEYNNVVKKLVDEARDQQKTEEEKALELKSQYEAILELAQTDEDRAAIQNKIRSIDEEIADAKAQELADQRDKLAKSLGISLDFSPEKTQEELFAEEKAKLESAFNDDGSGLIKSKEELNEAIDRLREKYSDAASADLSDQLGNVGSSEELQELRNALEESKQKGLILEDEYNRILEQSNEKEQELLDAQIEAIPGLRALIEANDAAKNAAEMSAKASDYASNYSASNPFDSGDAFSDDQLKLLQDNPNGILTDAAAQYASAMEAAQKALEENVIDNETYNELVNRANENLAKATDDAAEKLRKEAEQERNKARSELGIDSIMESLKSPAQKYAEKLQKASEALEKGQINEEEFAAFKNKLDQDEAERQEKLAGAEDKFKEEKKPESKDAPTKSMEGGSSDLYLALVKNSTANYQSRMQATTERMYGVQYEALNESRQMNYYLSQMLSGGESETPVWG